MERVKHLLFLLVFLLGVTSITNAQTRAPGLSDLDLSKVDLDLNPVSLTNNIDFTGCNLSNPIEVRVTMEGRTGVYEGITDPVNLGYNGKPQNVPLCYRVYWAGTGVDILKLGAYDVDNPVPGTYLENSNPASQGYLIAEKEGATIDENWYSGSVIIFLDPAMILAVGTGDYMVEAYYCNDRDEFKTTASFPLTAQYGIDLTMDNWDLYVGCVNPPVVFEPVGKFTPWCNQDFKLVIEYKGGGTDDVDVLDLPNNLNAVNGVLTIDAQYDPTDNTFSINDTDLPEAILKGCGTYTAHIAIKLAGTTEYVQASEKEDFTICGEYPYELTMYNWDLIYYAFNPLGCDNMVTTSDTNITGNNQDVFHIFGPAGIHPDHDNPDGSTIFPEWTANGHVYLNIWYESGDEVLNIPDISAGGFTFGNDGKDGAYGYGGAGRPHTLRVGTNFPPIVAPGCGKYKVQLVCVDGTIVSETEDFEIKVEYPVVAKIDEIEFCIDPICPKKVEYKFEIESKLCGPMIPLRFELVKTSGDVELFDELSWSAKEFNPSNPDQFVNATGTTQITLFLKPIATGTATYQLKIYHGDTGIMIGTAIEDQNGCPRPKDIPVEIKCCDFDPSQLKVRQDNPIPDPFCTADDNPLVLKLTALFKSIEYPTASGVGGGDGYAEVNCPNAVTFRFEADPANPTTLTYTVRGERPVLTPNSPIGWSGENFYMTFSGYGVGTFYVYPVIVGGCNPGGEGEPYVFTVDVRKPLTSDMLDDEVNGSLYYRTNGSDPFGPMVLTNDNLPAFNPDPNFKGNVVMDIIIYDPHSLVGYVEGAADPFEYDWYPTYHEFTGIPIIDGGISFPQIYLQNGANTQEPIYVYYGLRYADGEPCCDSPSQANPPASATRITPSCASGEFYIVVKPLDDAINQDLKAVPINTKPICFDEADPDNSKFEVELNALYHEKQIFENGGALPTGLEVRFRIDYVSGDQIIDLAYENGELDGKVITTTVNGPIKWEPVAEKAGKGVYMATPYFNEVMTLTNGVAVVFTLEAQEGLTAEMVGLNGQTLVFTDGDLVPAISLDAVLPAGAKVTWEWDNTSDYIGSVEKGNLTIPTFTAINEGTDDVTAKYTATIEYSDAGCPAVDDVEWFITVKPAIDGTQLVADPVAGEVLCKGGTFDIDAKAYYKGVDVTAEPETKFVVEFVSGDDVATFTPDATEANKFSVEGTRVGKGTYQLVPIYKDVRGIPSIFTIEVLATIDADMVGLNNQTLEYKNGDVVASIFLDTQLPAGATVTWKFVDMTLEAGCTAANIGAATAGNAYIPNFVALNTCESAITANYSFTISYPDSDCGSTATGTFSIKVNPNIIEDYNLTANMVSAQTKCLGDPFEKIVFSARHIPDGNITSEADYRVEFVSGDLVAELPPEGLVKEWKPKGTIVGKGVYRVVPIYKNGQGIPNTFTLTVLDNIEATTVGVNEAEFVYQNGDQVPAISLDMDLPVDAKVTWTATDGAAIGLNSQSGNAIVPSFIAINTGDTELTATVSFTIDNGTCGDTGTFEIKVLPNTIEDYDLVMTPVEGKAICSVKDGAFDAITFEAKRTDIAKFDTGTIKYVVSYVGGTNVVNLKDNYEVTVDIATATNATGSWIPTMATDTDSNPVVGIGTYRVTPFWNNGQGVPVLFTLEVRDGLVADMVALNGSTLIYKNADPVEPIYLDAHLPAGAKVTWKLKEVTTEIADLTVTTIGSTDKGSRFIPRFYAYNPYGKKLTAEYTFEIAYEGIDCAVATGNFFIEVQPNVVEDLNLVAMPVVTQTICENDTFEEIVFAATYVGEAAPVAADFRIEFVSGNAVVTLPTELVKKWTPTVAGVGTGVYRAVPIYENRQGVPVTFTLTVLEAGSLDMIGVNGATFAYQNGDHVPAISLDTFLPATATVSWTVTGDDIGLNSKAGNGIVPSFVAINAGLTELTATVTFTVSNGASDKCEAEGSFTIKVAPNTIEDFDLVMNPIANEQRICNDPDETFAPVVFTSKRTDGAAFATGNVRYVVSYVGGTNILDLTSGNTANAQAGTIASWTPVQAYDRFGNPLAGTGTYRVTPYWSNGQGVPALFTLTVYPVLDNNQIDVVDNMGNPVNFTYYNGDVVPEFNFLGTKVPAGVTIAWELKKDQPNIGSTTSGVGRMPAFVAVNKTNAPVTAEYIAWLKYEECSTKDDAVNFFITVNPRVLTDTDLHIVQLENQTICKNDKFEDVILELKHRFETITLPLTYEYELISGDNVLGSVEGVLDADCNPYTWMLSELNNGVVGTGTYRITPIMGNYAGRTVEITLTRLPAPEVDQVADIELCSGSPLEVVFTGELDGTKFDWVAETNSIGIPTKGNEFISVPKLVNNTDKPVKVKITVTPRLQGTECAGSNMEFSVTVNPVPVVNYMVNKAYVHGTKVGQGLENEIKFEGTATAYKWESSNPTIYEGLSHDDYTSGKVDADANGVAYLPTFTTANYTKEIITSTVTVTPLYGECVGEPIQFHILVKSETAGIILESVKDIVLCEGEATDPISFGLPLETYYYVTWTGGSGIGLADNDGKTARAKNIPSFVAQPHGTATVKVIPHIRYNSVEFDGTALEVKFTVLPKFDLLQSNLTPNGSETVHYSRTLSECNELLAPEDTSDIVLNSGVTGDYDYQWYKNNQAIVNATGSTYTIKYNDLSTSDNGDYVCIISSKSGCANADGATSVHTKTFKVTITIISNDVLVEQLWNDVLQVNCIQSENGGFTFTAFEWYYCSNGNLTAISYDAGYSWIRISSGDLTKQFVVKATDSKGTVHTSCPISLVSGSSKVSVYVAPSPVASGSSANVTVTGITEGTIQIVNLTGAVLSTTQMTGEITPVIMPSTSGNYIVKVIPATEGETAETKVIVK